MRTNTTGLKRNAIIGSTLAVLLLLVVACSTAVTPAPREVEVTRVVEIPSTPETIEITKEIIVEKEVIKEVVKEVVKEVEVMVQPEPMAMPGAGVTVKPARATWNTGYFQEALYSLALEELGYDVEDHKELDNPLFYQSVALGDVTYWANGWFPLHTQYEDTYSKGASIAGTVASAGALQGYLIDKAGAEEFGITTIDDFKRDDVKAAYDSDGNGKANLVACPPGWGCNTVISFHLDTFGLRDHVDEGTAGYSAGMADAIGRYRNGEHIFFYTWTPNWTVNQLKPTIDVVWIEIPSAEHPAGHSEAELLIDGVAGCANDPCLMGFPGNDLNIIANDDFLAANPSAAKLFEVMFIPLADIFKQNNRMNAGEDSQDDIDTHAKEWAATHQDLWNGWLDQARSAG